MSELEFGSDEWWDNITRGRTEVLKLDPPSSVYHGEKGYIKMISDVLNYGQEQTDRTGVGTISMFDAKVIYPEDEFGCFSTVKPAALRMAFEELWFFLRGETDTNKLAAKGINFWKPQTSRGFLDSRGLDHLPVGCMGKAYSHQFRNYGGELKTVSQRQPESLPSNPCYLGIADSTGARLLTDNDDLGHTWVNMINRCYKSTATGYEIYGGRGVSVCDRWLIFENFKNDVKSLPNWELKKENWSSYELDKDTIGSGLMYSPNNCLWVTRKDNNPAKYITVLKRLSDGKQFTMLKARDFAEDHGLDVKSFTSGISDLWADKKQSASGKAVQRMGFELVSRRSLTEGVDQLQNLINDLQKDPYSRRLMIDLWNPAEHEFMCLTPCWFNFQVVVIGDYLHMKLRNRSLDSVFGFSFAVQQYRLLQLCLCKMFGYKLGRLSADLSHVHIYKNQIEYARELVSRRKGKQGEVIINKELNTLEDLLSLEWSDFEITGLEVNTSPFLNARPDMAV